MEGFASLNKGVFILMFLITFLQNTETHCNETEAPTFGHNCSFFCHCMDNKQCDFTTGNCSNGCDFDWVGPACQRRNIIHTKDINNEAFVVTRHSSNILNSKFAKLAIDRNTNSCSYTNYANESRSKPWWRVWLEDRHTIRNILIVTLESATEYFKGFTVTIGNVSYHNRYNGKFHNSTVCYTHTSTSPETKTIHVTCSNDVIGNQIKIELASKNTQLVLCDVRIYKECQNGNFGETCTKRCSPHCKDICDKTIGTCATCEPRWTGSRCDQCSFNFYGDACEQGCGHCFNGNASCNSVNGTCLNGCEAGWKGNSCDRECDEGKYGQNCNMTCSPVCNFPAQCDKRNGSCFNGCKPGYTGSLCNRMCSEGFYGEECRQHCSKNCVNDSRICNNENGTCLFGCQEGWFGRNCSQECLDGKYGSNCSFSCSGNCKDDLVCRKDYGTCTSGCKAGYRGSSCFEECQNKTFGLNCAFDCGHCLNGTVCMHTNGYCMNGCEPGWTGDTCTEECQNQTYGLNCVSNCSGHCFNGSVCMPTNGSCMNGCEPGWTGNTCKEECQNQTYGLSCAFNCSGHCFNGSVCMPTNGSCMKGCEPGWTSDTCEDECQTGSYGSGCRMNCSEHCLNGSMCRSTDGHCLLNCSEGWIGERCDTKCRLGFYGKACALNCSEHCANASMCTHTNGSCLGGCDSGWAGETCEEEILKDVNEHSERRHTAITAGVSVSAFILVIAVVTAALCWKRKAIAEWLPIFKLNMLCPKYRKRDDSSYDNQMYRNTLSEREACDNVSMTSMDIEHVLDACTNPATDIYVNAEECTEYYNTTPWRRTPHAIPVENIASFVRDKISADGYFTSQFDLIATGLLHPTSTAERRENMSKNRFKKIYPYDHSRVILEKIQGQPYSDYINACYIKGQGKDRAYIASQGPVKENVEDFWRMIWEADIRTVVMVTNLTENGKIKCMQYWAEEEVIEYGQIQVTMRSEKKYAEFTTRVFSICHQDDANTKRDLIQFHYTAWPDKDVPRTTNGLLHFWRQVRKQDEDKQYTWLVHCSAGVGRTGTFLALDILYDQGVKHGFIDVYQCVKELRDQRVSMVQTITQYVFLHLLMLEVFCLPFRPIRTDNFITEFNSLQNISKPSTKTGLMLEYESLDDALYARKKQTVYIQNDRSEVDIPVEFRPKLSTFDPKSPNMIKAAYLPSYFNLRGYITAQYPLEHTSMETCRLIFEKQIALVLTFPNHGIEDKMPRQVLFEEISEERDPFSIVCQSQSTTDAYTLKDHVLFFKEKTHSFKEIVFKGWSSDSRVPETTGSILNLLSEVGQQIQRLPINQEQSILFQCWDGAERSALMVVLMNIMDRVIYDGEISIPQVIRQLRHIRKVIPNSEQYRFCYEVLYSRLSDDATYANA